MRWVRLVLCVTLPFAVLAGCLVWSTYGYYGVGTFDQVVVVESSKPVVKAWYLNTTINDSARYFMAHDLNPDHLGGEGPEALTGDRFTARLWFTDGPALWDRARCQPDLIVLVEFADGSRACEAVRVPRALNKEAVVVRFQ